MAQLIKLQLSRNDKSSPWGFRLQGGKDFGTQLLIQKVNFGSLAEKAGLQVGDALVRVNDQDVYDVKHKEAQDVILGAGNAFELTIQRGGTSVWKPSVTPIGPSPVPNRLSQSPQLVTKTSLAKVGPQSPAFGSSHNSFTRPFSGTSSPKVSGNDSGTVKAIVNKQYNTPVGIYSEENIAETLTAQAEVLAGGVLGVNFKKNEKNYDASHSEVLKMVQEADKEPKDLESEIKQCVINPIIQNSMRHVSAPEPKAPQNAPNQSICSDCERLVVGVFVRIKDKSLHVECFKCATCGSSLKNVGYYSINDKLYCDIHAKMIARQNPPAPELEPVTAPPGSHLPSGLLSSLSSLNITPTKPKDVQTVQSPQPSTLSPIPFHAPKAPSHVNAPEYQTPSKVISSNARPYEAPKQIPTLPKFTGGNNQVIQSDKPKYSTNSIPRLPFLKPKPSTGSAFFPVVSNLASYDYGKRASLCSQEVDHTINDFKYSINDSIAAQSLIKSNEIGRPQSPVPDDKGQDFTSAEVQSLLPQNNNTKAISPKQSVVSPPEISLKYRNYSKSPTIEFKQKFVSPVEPVLMNPSKINSVKKENAIFQHPDKYNSEIAELKYLPKFHGKKGPMSVAMEIAPDRPFTPVSVTEPIIKPTPWVSLPIENENRPESPLIVALKTAPERSYSPLPTFTYASELPLTPVEDFNNEIKNIILVNETPALAQNYSCQISKAKNTVRPIGNNPVRYMHGYYNTTSAKSQNKSTQSKPISATNVQKDQITGVKSNVFPSCNKPSIFGPNKSVESKNNCNEVIITREPEFDENEKYQPKNLFFTSEKNVPSNNLQNDQKLSKPLQLEIVDDRSISHRSIGPGIKDKVSTFTSNASTNDSFLKQKSNNHCKVAQRLDINSTLIGNGSYIHKNTHPNIIKLNKAVPFFSNKSSFPPS